MKKLFSLLLITIFAISNPAASHSSESNDLLFTIDNTKLGAIGNNATFDFQLKNVGENPISPSTLHYFFISPEFQVVKAITDEPDFYCPVNHVIGNVNSPRFNDALNSYTMLGCTSEPNTKKWRELAPGASINIRLELKVKSEISATSKVIGLHFPDPNIESHESDVIDGFNEFASFGGDITSLTTNNLTTWQNDLPGNNNLNTFEEEVVIADREDNPALRMSSIAQESELESTSQKSSGSLASNSDRLVEPSKSKSDPRMLLSLFVIASTLALSTYGLFRMRLPRVANG